VRGDRLENKENDEMNKILFYSEPTFETWDWTNPETKGIGGSETSHVEMAARLARRDNIVLSFAPVVTVAGMTMASAQIGPGGAQWMHSDNFAPFINHEHFVKTGVVYIIYRAPQAVDVLPAGANAWLICQDVDYIMTGHELTEERLGKFSRIVALCKRHADFLKARYPKHADRVFQSSNGIKREIIERIALEAIERNPKRLMYASSPDRGMEFLLDIFPRAKEIVPDLELHIYYGFDNIDKLVERYGEQHWISANAKRLKELTEQPGVVVHGRLGQVELTREWFKAGIWCHPSNFTETSCITSMDAQACGAIPITNPLWAVGENVEHGVFIEGDVRNDLIRSRYVTELVKLALDDKRQRDIRPRMMGWARSKFDWERIVDQWDKWATLDTAAAEIDRGLAGTMAEAMA
jgi:glycosyltransferase involved in cell wall biosynthesis